MSGLLVGGLPAGVDVAQLVSSAVEPTPSPSPSNFDENSVTPGWIGFTAIFLVGVVVLLLVLDMVRRIRRVRYRAEVQAQLDAEEAALRDEDGIQ